MCCAHQQTQVRIRYTLRWKPVLELLPPAWFLTPAGPWTGIFCDSLLEHSKNFEIKYSSGNFKLHFVLNGWRDGGGRKCVMPEIQGKWTLKGYRGPAYSLFFNYILLDWEKSRLNQVHSSVTWHATDDAPGSDSWYRNWWFYLTLPGRGATTDTIGALDSTAPIASSIKVLLHWHLL